MRCSVEDCMITTKSPNQGRCWKEYKMCHKCAIKNHPELYVYNLTTERKFQRRLGVRGHPQTVENKGRFGNYSNPFIEKIVSS